MKEKPDYVQQLNLEIEHRIKEMEQQNYQFPRHFDKRDYLVLAFVILICIGFLIAGVWM